MHDESSPLSVVHLVAPAPFGGLESVVEALAAGQHAAGDRVCVAAVLSDGGPSHPFVDALSARGVEVRALRIGAREYLRERREVRELLERRGAEVLHTHGYRPDVVDAPVARRMGVATVTTVHGYTGGGVRNRLYEWVQTRALRGFDAVIAVSAKLGSELTRAGVPAERLHVVRNAWAPRGDPDERGTARAALGLEDGAPVVGWLGRMSEEKAPDVMLRAFAAMERRDALLAMIGTGVLEARCRQLADRLGIGDRVRWLGVVPRAGERLRAFDALAITSWTEGTPISLLEAVAAGVPVVATAVGGIPDVVSEREALLAPAGDTARIAAALDLVLRDPAAAAARARAAAGRLASELAPEPWVRRHREVYGAALEVRRG